MQNASRRDFLVGAGAAAILSGCHNWGSVLRTQTAELLAQARAKKINILYIMTDDHAAHAISAYGSRVNRTPGIDRLAKEGMIFSDVMCTNPICGPSRASILTGRYSHMNGVPTFVSIDRGIETVGGHLRRAGYYTAFLGKWHVGGPKTVRDEDWDRWMVYENQGVYTFMDQETYEQFDLNKADVEALLPYLLPEMEDLKALISDGKVLTVEPPQKVTLTVTECEPVMKGASATGRGKPATCETGLTVVVPEYITMGERIVVETATGEFVGRAQ